jgi:hypothetical protein
MLQPNGCIGSVLLLITGVGMQRDSDMYGSCSDG